MWFWWVVILGVLLLALWAGLALLPSCASGWSCVGCGRVLPPTSFPDGGIYCDACEVIFTERPLRLKPEEPVELGDQGPGALEFSGNPGRASTYHVNTGERS